MLLSLCLSLSSVLQVFPLVRMPGRRKHVSSSILLCPTFVWSQGSHYWKMARYISTAIYCALPLVRTRGSNNTIGKYCNNCSSKNNYYNSCISTNTYYNTWTRYNNNCSTLSHRNNYCNTWTHCNNYYNF